MEDWSGGGPSGEFNLSGSQTCRQRLYLSCNLWFILIEKYFPVQWFVFDLMLYPLEYVKCFYIIDVIYARIVLTPWYSMLVLFTCCWGRIISIQAQSWKLNGDLLQPSGIRYEVWSFSVRHFISIAYWERWCFGVKYVCCGTPSHRNFSP